MKASTADARHPDSEEGPGSLSAVLLDFFNTLAIRRSLDDWIDDAASRVGDVAEDTRRQLRARLTGVWSDARALFPGIDWDLDQTAHRQVFIATVSRGEPGLARIAAELYELIPQQCVLNTGALEFVEALSGRGIKLAIVSNTALDIRPALRSWGIGALFDAVTLSFEAGYVKPNRRIFLLTAEVLHVRPEQCIMIGDSAAEDGGAVRAGMQCVISDSHQMWRAFDFVKNVLTGS